MVVVAEGIPVYEGEYCDEAMPLLFEIVTYKRYLTSDSRRYCISCFAAWRSIMCDVWCEDLGLAIPCDNGE